MKHSTQRILSALLAAGIIIGVVALLVLPIARLLTKDSYKRIVYHYSMTTTNYNYIVILLHIKSSLLKKGSNSPWHASL